MKNNTRFTFLAIMVFACTISFGQKSELAVYTSHFRNELKGWTKTFSTFNLASFERKGTLSFEAIDYMDIGDFRDFYSIYRPALTFSPDKNQFIDIYSYLLNLGKQGDTIVYAGGEADQAITLCNFKTKTWTRIFYRGTTERIQEVTWLNNSKFILAGIIEGKSGQQHPVIYIGDPKTKIFESYLSKNDKSIQRKAGYDSPKLLKLKIVQL